MRTPPELKKTLKASERPPRGIRVWWIERRKRWGIEWREKDTRPGRAGKLRKVMATRATKTDALAKAAQVEADRARFGRERAQGLDDRTLRELEQLREALGGASVTQLLEVWARHKNEVLGGEPGLTLGEAKKRTMADMDGLVALRRLSRVRHDKVERALGRFVGDLGSGTELVAVDEARVKRWLDEVRARENWAPVTMKHLTKELKAFFKRAVERKWIVNDPAAHLALPFVPKKQIATHTADEIEKLMAANRDEPVSLFLALELWGFLRFSGTQRLHREWIKPEERAFDLPSHNAETGEREHKSNRRHYLQGHPEVLWQWIFRWWDDPAPWGMSASQIMHAKSAAYKRAGVVNPGNGLRHTAASMGVALYGDAKLVARLLQHRDQDELYEHYLGRATKADAERWARIIPWGPFIPEAGAARFDIRP